jgi:hypothetical protein
MKIWSLIPLALLFSLQVSAKSTFTEDQYLMLTPSEFSSLTHAEQKTYIKKLREIFVEINEGSPHLAAEFVARSSVFASLMNAGVAEAQAAEAKPDYGYGVDYAVMNARAYLKAVNLANKTKLSDDDKKLMVAQYEQAIKYTQSIPNLINSGVKADAFTKEQKDYADKAQADMTKEMDTTAEKIKSVSANSPALKHWESAKVDMVDGKFPNSTSGMVPFGDAIPGLKKSEKVAAPAAVTATTEKTGKSKVTVGTTSDKESAKESKDSKEKDKGEKTKLLYRCMYSGFIIKNDPCRGPTKLPFELNGLNFKAKTDGKNTLFEPKDFKCDKEDEIICNPLVFGARVDCDWKNTPEKDRYAKCMMTSKPYCVSAGGYATRDCDKQSNNDTAIEVAVYVMSLTDANKKVAIDFNKSFSELCDGHLIDFNRSANKAKTLGDISRTCEVARTRLKAIRSKYVPKDDSKKTLREVNPNAGRP